jgi:hypothetical protein
MPAIVFLAEWVEQWMSEIQQGYADLELDAVGRAGASACQSERSSDRFFDPDHLHYFVAHPVFCLAVPLLLLAALVAASHGHRNRSQTIAGLPYTHPEQLMLLSRSAGVVGIASSPSIADLRAWQANPRLSLAGFVFEGLTLQVTPNFYALFGAVPHLRFRFLGREAAVVADILFERVPAGRLSPPWKVCFTQGGSK